MRLTNENYDNDVTTYQKQTFIDKDGSRLHMSQYQYNNALWNSAKEKEDIEEELGIDLLTLFKASQQRYIFVKNAFGEISSREINSIDIYTKIIVYYLEYQTERQFMHQPLNMYGKTWALNKEELK